jgi:membrane protease YdiL (CAAX protease family)
MSFIETVAVGRAFRQKGEPQPDPDRELVALGAANVAGGFFGWLRLRSGSILAPWLTHIGFNSIGYLGSRLEGLLSK